ncbi:MAG: hypothetical protein LQ342_005731 [Letrouitia transgressa]|nr:MAG: hypothetical protein LQ342_005731 [Letrouitia transgressa]
MATPTWQEIAEQAQQIRDASLSLIKPALPETPSELPRNVTGIPKHLLTTDEVVITQTPPEDLVTLLAAGKLTSTAVTNAFLRRAGLAQKLTNCITELLPEEALARAKELDEHYREHKTPIGPLHGLPISVKEHIGMKGKGLNAGFVSWWDRKGEDDANVLKILWKAGCVFYARTTQPQTLMHLETSNNLYGVTRNPFNRDLTSGGSSGGEGALIGLRGSCLGIGSDIGGSVRSPSANCGLYGLKPTSYRVPTDGWSATMAGEEQIVPVMGPLSTSLEGVKLFMRTVLAAQPWLFEPSLVPIPWRDQETQLSISTSRKLKVGIMWSDGIVKPHPPIIRALNQVADKLKGISEVEVVSWTPYRHDEAWEIIASLYFSDGANEEKEAIHASGEPWRPLSEFIIKENPYVKHLSIEEVWYWTVRRESYRRAYAKVWNDTATRVGNSGELEGMVDVILAPVGPGVAPPLDHARYWGYTSQWNLLDYPALVFPVSRVNPEIDEIDKGYKPKNEKDDFNYKLYEPKKFEGAPISLQLIGRRYEDEKIQWQTSDINPRRILDSQGEIVAAALRPRALPNAPDGYTPETQDCPSRRPTIRSASDLSPNESSWLDLRRSKTVEPMRDFLMRAAIPGFDAEAYINQNVQNQSALPNIGIAVSGGGYRALMNGAGAIQAFDSREDNSTAAGHLGGLLQSATYLSGLSGGGWLVGSIFMNNYSSISGLLNDPSSTVWRFENSIFEGPKTGSVQLFDSARYFSTIQDQVSDKEDAGFNTSVTDYWGRALSFQLINATAGGVDYTWSSIAQADNFMQGDTPFPILVADGRAPGEQLVSLNATVYEFNPFEFGTWDPTTFGFAPLEYLGSNFSNGVLFDPDSCVRGFDNAGYVMGTSSSLFNQFLLQVDQQNLPQVAKDFISLILKGVGEDQDDIADYTPNPFYGYHNSTSRNSAQSRRLTLVDGGEDLQNIPLHPLLQPERAVDVIFAVDSSADTTTFWPNGTSLVASYERSLNASGIANGTAFPAVPDQNTFVNLGLNSRPTFFGCDSANTSAAAPLLVYLPNAPYIFHSNVSTFTPSYDGAARAGFVRNGYEVATMGNGTADAQWPVCVACAVLSRSWERTGTSVPEACARCFGRYCWDGRTDGRTPAPYEPPFKGAGIQTSGAGRGTIGGAAAAVMAVAAAMLVAA